MATTRKRKRMVFPEISSESELEELASPKKESVPSKLKSTGSPEMKRGRQEENVSHEDEDQDVYEIHKDSEGFADDAQDGDAVTDGRKSSSQNSLLLPLEKVAGSPKLARNKACESTCSSEDSECDVALAVVNRRKDVSRSDAHSDEEERDTSILETQRQVSPRSKVSPPSDEDMHGDDMHEEEDSGCEKTENISFRGEKASHSDSDDVEEEVEELSDYKEQGNASPQSKAVSSSDEEDSLGNKEGRFVRREEHENTSSCSKKTPSSDDDEDDEDDDVDDVDDEEKDESGDVDNLNTSPHGKVESSSDDDDGEDKEEKVKDSGNKSKGMRQKAPSIDFDSPRTLQLKKQIGKSKPVVQIGVMDKTLLQGLMMPHSTISLQQGKKKRTHEAECKKVENLREAERSAFKRQHGKTKIEDSSSADDSYKHSDDNESCDDEDDAQEEEDFFEQHGKLNQGRKNPPSHTARKSPRKASLRMSSQTIAKSLERSSSDENEDSGASSSSDSDEPLSDTRVRLPSNPNDVDSSSGSDSDSGTKNAVRKNPSKQNQNQKQDLSKGKKKGFKGSEKVKSLKVASREHNFEDDGEILKPAGKQTRKKTSISKANKKKLTKCFRSDSDSDSILDSDESLTSVLKTKSRSPKLKSPRKKSSEKNSVPKSACYQKSKFKTAKSLKTLKSLPKSPKLTSDSESESDNQDIASRGKKKPPRCIDGSESDVGVPSDDSESNSDDEPLSVMRTSSCEDRRDISNHKKKKTNKMLDSPSESEASDTVENKAKCKVRSKMSGKKQKESSRQNEGDSSSSEDHQLSFKRPDSAEGKEKSKQQKAKKRSKARTSREGRMQQAPKDESHAEGGGKMVTKKADTPEVCSDTDSSSVSLTISSLSSLDGEEEKRKTKKKKKTEKKARHFGSKGHAKERRGSSSDGPAKKRTASGDAKASSQRDSKRMEHFKKFVRLCGLRVVYVKLFADVEDEKDKINILVKVLRDAGLKGKPTITKCCQLKERRDELAELAALDADNIITGNAKSGRSRRRNVHSMYLKHSPGAQKHPSPSPKRIKRVDHFANLRGIISDDSDSD